MAETPLPLARKAAEVLSERGIENARLEAELLLAAALGIGRLDLYLQFERPVAEAELERFRASVRRRLKREPLQYILGSAHFRELVLRVDPRVLIPRPETEELVGEVLAWSGARGDSPLDLVELGTGSGAIALSLAREGAFRRVVATDVSPEALALARENAHSCALGDCVEFRCGALWNAVGDDDRFDVVVSNPPYVTEAERGALAPEVARWEPSLALFGGESGFDVLEPLVAGAPAHLREGGLLALEIGAGQGAGMLERLAAAGVWTDARVVRDLAGRDRIVLATLGR